MDTSRWWLGVAGSKEGTMMVVGTDRATLLTFDVSFGSEDVDVCIEV